VELVNCVQVPTPITETSIIADDGVDSEPPVNVMGEYEEKLQHLQRTLEVFACSVVAKNNDNAIFTAM
jgi:hypothetical protein